MADDDATDSLSACCTDLPTSGNAAADCARAIRDAPSAATNIEVKTSERILRPERTFHAAADPGGMWRLPAAKWRKP